MKRPFRKAVKALWNGLWVFRRCRLFDYGKFVFTDHAERAFKVVGKFFKGCSGGDAGFGYTFGGVVFPAANVANVFFHLVKGFGGDLYSCCVVCRLVLAYLRSLPPLKLRLLLEALSDWLRVERELPMLFPPRPPLGRLLPLFPGRYPSFPPGRWWLCPGLCPGLPGLPKLRSCRHGAWADGGR